ncbi:MAG: hypothetical protein HY897_17155 [Deltaproteobacteria bacterium]|nr:hypothetical protein [Deltaproteobacteria bacterium]
MRVLISLVMYPLVLLEVFGAIVSGIWLAIVGQWWAIGYGLLALFAPFVLGLVMVPGLLFAVSAYALAARGRSFLAFPFVLLGQVWAYAVVCAWCLGVFFFFTSRTGPGTFWPLLIWSYGVALGPWMYMAEKEERSGAANTSRITSALTAFFAQLGYIAIGLALAFAEVSAATAAIIFGTIMLATMLIHTFIVLAATRARSAPPEFRGFGMSDSDFAHNGL